MLKYGSTRSLKGFRIGRRPRISSSNLLRFEVDVESTTLNFGGWRYVAVEFERSGLTYSLHCSSIVGLPCRILISLMEAIGVFSSWFTEGPTWRYTGSDVRGIYWKQTYTSVAL